MSNNSLNKNKKNKVVGIVTTVFLIVALLLCVYITVQVLTNGYASFGGYSLFRVVTGSMEPEIEIGSLILTEKADINDINVNDIVTFTSRSGDMLGEIITHRVIDKTYAENGAVLLYTKGDANTVADLLPVDSSNYIGRVVSVLGNASVFSQIMSFLTSPSGFIICVVLPILMISGFLMQKSIKNIKKDMEALSNEVSKTKEEQASLKNDTLNKSVNDSSNGLPISDEDYREIYERLRAELTAEIKEELKESDGEEQT